MKHLAPRESYRAKLELGERVEDAIYAESDPWLSPARSNGVSLAAASAVPSTSSGRGNSAVAASAARVEPRTTDC
jgi:hypothetical protein